MKKAILAAFLFFTAGNLNAEDLEIFYERTVDGDTFLGTIKGIPEVFGNSIPIRLARIDTAEIRQVKCLKQAEMGEKARDELRRLLEEAQKITLKNPKRDSFFRVVAEVYIDGSMGYANVNDLLLISGLALPYNGRGEKPNWCR